MAPKTGTTSFRHGDDYITARAANPFTGLVSPSICGRMTPRTPATPGEALAMYSPAGLAPAKLAPHPSIIPGPGQATCGIGEAPEGGLGGVQRRPQMLIDVGKRATTRESLEESHHHDRGKLCLSDETVSTPTEGMTRVKTVWRETSRAWQEKRMLSRCAAQTPKELDLVDESINDSRFELQTGNLEPPSPRQWTRIKRTDSTSATKRSSGLMPSRLVGAPAATPRLFDLRTLPPVMLRRPSKAACKRLDSPFTQKPTNRAASNNTSVVSLEQPDVGLAAAFVLLTNWLRGWVQCEENPVLDVANVFDVSLERDRRIRAATSLMKLTARICLVLYTLACILSAMRMLLYLVEPVLWPLLAAFKVAKWIISF